MSDNKRSLETTYSAALETLYLLAIPSMREAIIEGMETPIEKCLNEDLLDW